MLVLMPSEVVSNMGRGQRNLSLFLLSFGHIPGS